MVFEGIDENSRCVFDDYSSVSWQNSQTDPSWIAQTGKLKQGTYTIVAFKPTDTEFSAPKLHSIDGLGVPYAQTIVEVNDDETTHVELDVPDFDMQYALAKMGVKSASTKVPTSAIVVGLETIVEVNFEIEEWAGARISLDIPSSDYYSDAASAAFKDGGQAYVDSQQECLYIDIPQEVTSDTLYIALTPEKEKSYSIPVSPIQQRAHNPHRQSLLPGIGNLRPSTRRLCGSGRKHRHRICRALFRRRALHRRTERRDGNHQFPWPRKHLVRYPRGHSERPFARRQREDRDSSRRIDQLQELRLPPRSANMVLQDGTGKPRIESPEKRKATNT